MIAYFNRFELKMTRKQAQQGSHQGRCDEDVAVLMKVPQIAKQLQQLDPEKIKEELKEYGAWEDEELQDLETNHSRIVWLAAGMICDDEK